MEGRQRGVGLPRELQGPPRAPGSRSRSAEAVPSSAAAAWVSSERAASPACRSGRRGTTTSIAMPIAPPTSASRPRLGSRPSGGGTLVATSTALAAAWPTSSGVPPASTAAAMASTTTSATCTGPLPICPIRASPTRMPRDTPKTISTAPRVRWPGAMPSTMTAAIGAKKARSWPSRSCATNHASPAPTAVCRIRTPLGRSARTRSRAPSRTRAPSEVGRAATCPR